MRRTDPLILGGLVLVPGLLLGLLSQSEQTQRPWPGPAGTRWAGTELRRVNLVTGREGMVSRQYLELRCRRLPVLKLRTGDYWPGPAWAGWAEWSADRVTYRPGWAKATPKIKPVTLAVPWWLPLCSA
ncbi:hypothetical protein [Deinococcus reticulitermitis]|nr:hypothetical protein [Deinococcus reticulitermitis]